MMNDYQNQSLSNKSEEMLKVRAAKFYFPREWDVPCRSGILRYNRGTITSRTQMRTDRWQIGRCNGATCPTQKYWE
ncbi:unnamed protein product [Macrosiphum euphorbiae]|uniref:Uncharacterized protein n=1 Tax=Macrosiphum euphorbiae TaxID=13131 RepID=A0AAV0XGQ6_9HEMI|nr:unnamed protein product [Macrosiphum euphorbiae]